MATNSETKKTSSGKIITVLFSALFLLIGAPSFAQETDEMEPLSNTNSEVGVFEKWDTNKDSQIDQDEFSSIIGDPGLHGDWDTNYDGVYDDDELYTGFFNDWDTDKDGYIDRDEYATGNTEWELEYGDNFEEWDANDDDRLDVEEYSTAMNQTGVTGNWDANSDGLYSDDEVNGRFFDRWDTDNDGFLNEDEFNEVGFESDFND